MHGKDSSIQQERYQEIQEPRKPIFPKKDFNDERQKIPKQALRYRNDESFDTFNERQNFETQKLPERPVIK